MNKKYFIRSGALFLKNSLGKSTNRKIITFSVDDYGVQRTASLEARNSLEKLGFDVHSNRFDRLDSLETAEDLMNLFEVLRSVKDINNNPAIFTAFACPANIDYTTLLNSKGEEYNFKLLPDFYNELGYKNMMSLWKDGIKDKVINVQYHGREHANIKVLQTLLRNNDKFAWACIKNSSWTGVHKRISPNLDSVSTYQFDVPDEIPGLIENAIEGLDLFEKVWGYRAKHFTAPGNREPASMDKALYAKGIEYIDTDIIKREHQGNGKYIKSINLPFSRNSIGQYHIIRNCVYEPMLPLTDDWTDYVLFQIDAAFKRGKPANISTHRVNFSGNLSTDNRDKHLKELKQILYLIKKNWPDVEFMSTCEMIETVLNKR